VAATPQDAVFTIPDDFLCPDIPELPDLCEMLLPGGVEMADVDLIRLVQPALAPLVPIFDILEAIVAIKNCIEAIPDALGPPPDPLAMSECIGDLASKIAQVLRLLPQYSVPILARQIIDCLIAELLKVRRFLVDLQQQLLRIARIVEKAAELDDPHLQLISVCATDRLANTLSNEMKALIALGRLLGMLRTMLGLIGVDDDLIPDLNDIAGAPLDEAIEPLDSIIDALRSLKDLVPLPEEG